MQHKIHDRDIRCILIRSFAYFRIEVILILRRDSNDHVMQSQKYEHYFRNVERNWAIQNVGR